MVGERVGVGVGEGVRVGAGVGVRARVGGGVGAGVGAMPHQAHALGVVHALLVPREAAVAGGAEVEGLLRRAVLRWAHRVELGPL